MYYFGICLRLHLGKVTFSPFVSVEIYKFNVILINSILSSTQTYAVKFNTTLSLVYTEASDLLRLEIHVTIFINQSFLHVPFCV